MISIDVKLQRPLYVQIRDNIRSEIQEGKLKPGDRLPGERELAASLGVSVSIVRKALTELADEGFIFRREHRGTIVAEIDLSSRALLRTTTTATIGVVMEGPSDPFMRDVVKGIQDRLCEDDYQMFFCDCGGEIDSEISHVDSLVKKDVDGMIIYPVSSKTGGVNKYSHFRGLLQSRMPFMLIDRYIKNLETDYVIFDNYGGAFEATSYLAELGHKKIAHITVPESNTAANGRMQGYLDALAAASLSMDMSLVRHCGYVDHNHMREIVAELIENGVTAILCVTDYVAANIQVMISEMGLRVPDDVSLAGFSMQDAMDLFYPHLTTLGLPSHSMGYKAADFLLAKIQGRDSEVRRLVLPLELRVGATTASPRSECHLVKI